MNDTQLAPIDTAQPLEVPEPSFVDEVYRHDGSSLNYKLYVPLRENEQPAPLLLMLHGCGQDAQDFATGTRMNAIAQASGMYVIYPNQSSSANANRCWNWFDPSHQSRDSGEPATLSALTRQIMDSHPIDPDRVFVAGLSAGGAMALILAEQYPELYTAVGVHSGLPTGAASSMMQAFSLMQNSSAVDPTAAAANDDMAGSAQEKPGQQDQRATNSQTDSDNHTPLIVFHGDRDRAVASANAHRIVANWLARESDRMGVKDWETRSQTHTTDHGRSSVVSCFVSTEKPELTGCEYWQLGEAGHNWSGGNSDGSYTDAHGPDASAEMVRFFLEK